MPIRSREHLRSLGLRQKLLQGNQAGRPRIWIGNVDLVGESHRVTADNGGDMLLFIVHMFENLSQNQPEQAL